MDVITSVQEGGEEKADMVEGGFESQAVRLSPLVWLGRAFVRVRGARAADM